MKVQRLCAGIPADLPGELFEDVLRTDTFRLERIVSRGHTTPAGEWCEQGWDEWVVVLQGGTDTVWLALHYGKIA